MDNCIKVDTYEGTGAAIDVSLGFVPDFVAVVNTEDGDNIGLWFDGMAAGTAIDIAAAVAANAADGFTRYVGDATHAPGFTVGTDYSENAKTYYYIALRTSSGA